MVMYAGWQECPWLDDFRTDFDVLITKKNSKEEIFFSGLAIHLIHEHKFYEGKSTKYRLDPEKAVKFFDLQKFKETLEYCTKALEINHKNTDALYKKGESFFYLGKYDEAIGYFDKTLEIDPEHSEASRYKEIIIQQKR